MAEAIASDLVGQLATKRDMKAAFSGLKRDLDAANTGLKGNLEAANRGLKGDLEAAVARLEGSIRLLQWMIGFTLAFVVAIA